MSILNKYLVKIFNSLSRRNFPSFKFATGILLLAITSLISCSEPQPLDYVDHISKEGFSFENDFNPELWDPCINTEYTFDSIQVKILEFDELPYIEGKNKIDWRDGVYHLDNDSIIMLKRGDKLYYHPVAIAQFVYHVLDVYYSTQREKYLALAKKHIDKLVSLGIRHNGSIYFPYTFNFTLHGIENETLQADWYSAMAQGQILSIVTRYYELSKDEDYLELAELIFKSFLNFKGNENPPWVTCIDGKGNLWLEEYPMEMPCFTLNGMIFSIYGVYDYYRVTKNPEVKSILKGSISTIRRNIEYYRVKDNRSLYCLKHHVKVHNFGYQRIHIGQLNELYKMTGINLFHEMADNFSVDIREREKEYAENIEKYGAAKANEMLLAE